MKNPYGSTGQLARYISLLWNRSSLSSIQIEPTLKCLVHPRVLQSPGSTMWIHSLGSGG